MFYELRDWNNNSELEEGEKISGFLVGIMGYLQKCVEIAHHNTQYTCMMRTMYYTGQLYHHTATTRNVGRYYVPLYSFTRSPHNGLPHMGYTMLK